MKVFPENRVAVIGLGTMGKALAQTFLKAGLQVTVWNRSMDKAEELISQGAISSVTVSEALANSSIVVVCLLNYDVVQQVLGPESQAWSGKTIVNLTNGTPEQARTTAAWITAAGAYYLDGGIMAVPPMIGQPEALILYSGSSVAFEEGKSVLHLLGTSQYLGAEPGLAALYDLSLLSAMYGMLGGFLHAVALVGTEKVPATNFSPLAINWLQAMLAYLPHLAYQIDTGNYTENVTSNLHMQTTAFVNIIETSQKQGIRVDLMAPVQLLMNQTIQRGHGQADFSSLIEVIRQP